MKKLIIEGGTNSTFAFLDEFRRILVEKGWQRDKEQEQELIKRNHGAGFYATIEHCIIYPKEPRAKIFFVLQEAGDLTVTHMQALDQTRLTMDQYDQILDEFFDMIIKEAQQRTGVSIVYE